MKMDRRLLALILALAMVLSMGATAFAQDSGEETVYLEDSFTLEDIAPAAKARSVTNLYDALNASAKQLYAEIAEALDGTTSSRYTFTRSGITGDSQEAVEAALGAVLQDTESAINALQMDRPELFYWMDKTNPMHIAASASGGVGSFSIYFQVIIDYAGAQYGEEPYIYYDLLGGKIDQARVKAQEIVDGCSGLSDYEKIVKFNDWLCANVRYDDDAAAGSAYTNAYQMTGAFVDGHAVCEGYAKAFKYLCDQSGIDCELVTGLGKGSNVPGATSGAGNHMWNYVKLGGAWYLVDVTWNDGLGTNEYLCVGSNKTSSSHDPKNTEQGENDDVNTRIISATDYDPNKQPPVTTYTLTLGKVEGITVSSLPESAKAGDTITLNVSVNEGYEKPFVLAVNSDALAENAVSFTMPAENVVITGSATAIVPANLKVTLDPEQVKLTLGASSLVTANVTMADGSAYTGGYNWITSDSTVAELSETGDPSTRVVTAKNKGTATITVSVTGNVTVSGFATVYVDVDAPVEPDDPKPDDPKPVDPVPDQPSGGGSSSDDDDDDDDWWNERTSVETRSPSSSRSKTDEKSVLSQTRAAVKAAKDGQAPAVSLRNVASISRSILQSAQKESGAKDIVFHFDTVKKNVVESRLYLRPSLLQGSGKDALKLGVTINPANQKKLFDRYYSNRYHLITFSQKGGFGGAIEVAAKLDLKGFNTGALSFYRYDSKANTFYKLSNVKYFVDANGYLHIQNLSDLDTVIVTDGAMTLK